MIVRGLPAPLSMHNNDRPTCSVLHARAYSWYLYNESLDYGFRIIRVFELTGITSARWVVGDHDV